VCFDDELEFFFVASLDKQEQEQKRQSNTSWAKKKKGIDFVWVMFETFSPVALLDLDFTAVPSNA